MTNHDMQPVYAAGSTGDNSDYSVTSLRVSPDFILATAGAALLDRELQLLLEVHFRALSDDEYSILFHEEHRGVLSTFEGKIRVGYAAGFLGKELYEDLLLVSTIRNLFVNSLEPSRFGSESIENTCRLLRFCRNEISRTGRMVDARGAFYETLLDLQIGLQFVRRGDLAWAV